MAFPVSPTEGQTFTENNTVWIYSAVTDQWNRSVINPLNQTTYIGSDGAPGGIGGATQVIFNDNGSLASDAGLVYNKTTDVLTTGSLRATSLGTAAAPGIAFASDPNTGIYSPGADQLAVATNGTGRLFIDATGNVGVGLSNPSYPLEVASSTNSTINITGGTSNSCRLFFSDTALARGFLNYDHADDSINIGTAGSERLRITSAGLVGIGTSAPQDRLSVNASAANTFAANFFGPLANLNHVLVGLSDDATTKKAGIGFQRVDGFRRGSFFIFNNNDANGSTSGGINDARLTVTSAGNVGIGTTSPSNTLEISKESNHGITLARPAGGVNPGNVKLEVSSFGAGTLTADNNLSLTTGSSQQLIVNRGATESFRVDASSRLLVGTSTAHNVGGTLGNAQFSGAGTQVHFVSTSTSPSYVNLAVGSNGADVTAPSVLGRLRFYGYHTNGYDLGAQIEAAVDGTPSDGDLPTRLVFSTTSDSASSPTERLHIKANGSLRYTGNGSISATTGYTSAGVAMEAGGVLLVTRSSYPPMWVNRLTNDGTLVDFAQNSVVEGTISVSGTTVSYNGAHLSRWSQLPNGAERNNILRGSILSNIDEMCEWIDPPTETVLWAEGDELPEGVSVGDVKEQAKSGGPQANEQLNRMKVSDVEGDKNVSGVFQCWDDDDDTYTNDFYCAMTGDFIIRIAEGVTVERGDLLMSAGDGTAKPQDDDIIRSKTIAKVTSINVSCTYEDGSYCVPCVLMAC
jgi:hypothetical protein